jgi:prevent-host-death family protein
MPKSVSTATVRRSLNEILDTVRQRGEQFIIERRGMPIAAIVPLHTIEQRRLAKERVFQIMSEVHAKTAHEDSDELEQLVVAECAAVRRKRTARLRAQQRAERKPR